MREVSWGDAPQQLVTTMQASVRARLAGVQASTRPDPVDLASLSCGQRWILPKAHNAVRRREATKSLLVDITNRFKRSYRALATVGVRTRNQKGPVPPGLLLAREASAPKTVRRQR